MPDFRSVLCVVGFLLLALAAAMLLPAAIDALSGSSDWPAFIASALIIDGVGGALVLGYHRPRRTASVPAKTSC